MKAVHIKSVASRTGTDLKADFMLYESLQWQAGAMGARSVGYGVANEISCAFPRSRSVCGSCIKYIIDWVSIAPGALGEAGGRSVFGTLPATRIE